MRFTTYMKNGQPRLAVVDGSDLLDLNQSQPSVPSEFRSALSSGLDLCSFGRAALADGNGVRIPLREVELGPIIPNPGKVICLGLNYVGHAKESGLEIPEYPAFFWRGGSSLIGHRQSGIIPKASTKFDYEAELAVVIGKAVPRHTAASDALKYVFGYACFNDMSVRDFQIRSSQWCIGKNFDGTGALGPQLVTADELPDGASGLRIQTRLNGRVVQDDATDEMIFGVARAIELLAEALTLEPGDVIAMGTPSGVGQSRHPPMFLRSGDLVEVEIEGIGVLSNPISAEA